MIDQSHALISVLFAVLFLGGIRLMRSPRTAVAGNLVGSLGMLGAIAVTLVAGGIVPVPLLWIALIIGALIGYFLAVRVTMIKMPQMVALLNGLGGGASAGAAMVVMGGGPGGKTDLFTAALALLVGGVTLSGSLVAALKLDRRLSPHPVILPRHVTLSALILLATATVIGFVPFVSAESTPVLAAAILAGSLLYGVVFSIRIGGADMPITISLLNSLSGLAAAIAGFAVRDPLLIATGAIVGSAGLILTRIMCRAMNRSLPEILLGNTSAAPAVSVAGKGEATVSRSEASAPAPVETGETDTRGYAIGQLRAARTVIIIPGYGMALSQAQHQVKALFDLLESQGKTVRFAIHPVAGRMPGHMNVLLAEADVPYEKLEEMESINPLFAETDAVIIVGANDVINPAANTAQGTPIYGMPILNAGEAKFVLIFNKDTRPGYAGVENPLYSRENVELFAGDAAETLAGVVNELGSGA